MQEKGLFQSRPAWCLLGALILVTLPLLNPSPAAAQSVGEYFQISYEAVELSNTEVQGDEVFSATIRGSATCINDLPISASKARITSRVVAEHKISGARQILNSSYTIDIEPFPSEKGDTTQINKVIPLQFPAKSQSGDYNVVGELIEAKVKVLFAWVGVTAYLPQTQTMGSVSHISLPPPEQELYKGINFVSYGGAIMAVADAVASLPAEALASVWHFDNENKQWEVYVPSAPPYASDLKRMVSLQPYVIVVRENCSWSY